jgi:site-specific recombinase XerD
MSPLSNTVFSAYNIKSEYGYHSIEVALASGSITLQDRDLITEFIEERKAVAHISPGRANKIIFNLVTWRRFIGPYTDLVMAEVYRGISALSNGKSKNNKPFKQNTVSDFITILKQFLLWMIENEYSNLPEKKIRGIKSIQRDKMTKTAADLLTPDEVGAIINGCHRVSDRALIALLYEGGFRIGEMAQLTWGAISFDSYGAVININFKTGVPRYIRIIMMVQHLQQWRAAYPGDPTGSDLVFVNQNERGLNHQTVIKRLGVICRRVGITKHVTPHLFRHSRITHLIQEGVSESVIKMVMWGSLHTDQFRTYVHLTGKDIDNEMMRTYGISKQGTNEWKRPRLEPQNCPHCHTTNPPTSIYCCICGENLKKILTRDDAIKQFIINNFDTLQEYLRELKATSDGGD